MTVERRLLKNPKVKSFSVSHCMAAPACIGCDNCCGILTMDTAYGKNKSRTIIGGYFCKTADDFVEPPAYCPDKTEKMP
ncbi:MAG TPA: hypothetical protein O0X39_07065 [Methanocorpusculum sp.]|nr:hypothetical protein [Methanocorpusculum sp.]